jgi:hypothetical protein
VSKQAGGVAHQVLTLVYGTNRIGIVSADESDIAIAPITELSIPIAFGGRTREYGMGVRHVKNSREEQYEVGDPRKDGMKEHYEREKQSSNDSKEPLHRVQYILI